jgi:hypothetical protein
MSMGNYISDSELSDSGDDNYERLIVENAILEKKLEKLKKINKAQYTELLFMRTIAIAGFSLLYYYIYQEPRLNVIYT